MLLKGKGIITDLQRKILLVFSEIPGSEMFYLTDGTALAEFYLAHRRSYDLDLFTTEKGFAIQFSHTFEETMKKLFQVKTIRRLLNFATSGEKFRKAGNPLRKKSWQGEGL